MSPEIPLAVLGLVMLARGLRRWQNRDARAALTGAAMISAAAFAYFMRRQESAFAFASAALLAACVLAAVTTSRQGWKKPEVILGLAAILMLLVSILVLPGRGQLYFAIAAAVFGFASMALSLRSVIADIVPSERGQPS